MAGQFRAKVSIVVDHTQENAGVAMIQTEALGTGNSVQEALADSLGRMLDPSTLRDLLSKLGG